MPIIDRVKVGDTIYFVRDNQLASAIIASEYDSSLTYHVDEYCTYENLVYKCIYEISSPEEWNSNHWSNIRVLNEISDKAEKTDTVLNSTLSRDRAPSTVIGQGSIAFGANVEASGGFSEAKGLNTIASGDCSTARGMYTSATESCSNVFGRYNVIDIVDYPEWEANTSYAVGDHVKVTDDPDVYYYVCIVANDDAEFDANNWDEVSKPEGHLEVVGNGMTGNDRSNARALDFDGNEYLNGDLYVHCDDNSDGGLPVSPMIYLDASCVTKDLIFAKLSKLSYGGSATIDVTTEAMTVLSGGVSSASNVGVVSRLGNNGIYDFIFKFGSAVAFKTCRLTGATSASAEWTWTERVYGQKITLTSTYTTWASIWSELSKLQTYETASFYAHGNAFSVISRNARQQTVTGVVTKINSDGDFVYVLTAGSGTSRYPITAMSYRPTSSSEGTYYEYDVKSAIDSKINTSSIKNNLSTSDTGYVLDASRGKALNDRLAKVEDRAFNVQTINANSTKNITLENNGRYFIIFSSVAASAKCLGIVSVTSAGVVNINVIGTASNLSFSTATNKLVVENGTSQTVKAFIETLET